MVAACFGLVHDDCTRYWCQYMMIVPFAQIACYGTVTITFLIVTVNIEYHIIVLITRDFAFQI